LIVPQQAPEEVECSPVSPTAIRVNWQPIPLHLQGGAMQGYTLLYINSGRNELILIFVKQVVAFICTFKEIEVSRFLFYI
jgi:hypothetical protein